MTQINIRPVPKRRLADILYGQLLEQIMDGALVLGQKLPTENSLCKAFGASRPIVREALMRLQADGLVESRRGSGTYLARTPSRELSRFVEPADFAVYLRAHEVRMALEAEAARYAARRRTGDQLDDLHSAADAFSTAVEQGHPAQHLDRAFHRSVAAASGNELFVRQLEELTSEIEGLMNISLGLTRLGSADRRAAVVQEHRQITDAIGMGDADLAEVYMRFHLSQARRRMTDVTRQP
jgi:DNA-binding FadR family transcriptional regulator